MSYERIDESPQFDGAIRAEHEARYRLASGFVEYGDTILDACCGTGYGKNILTKEVKNVLDSGIAVWTGFDRSPANSQTMRIDLEAPDYAHQYSIQLTLNFDVFVGLECIEHLSDEGVQRLVRLAQHARKWIVVSTPIVRNGNPHHKQQFSEEQMLALFADRDWQHHQTFYQDKGRYGIFIFKRI
jgi:2-polyprenyl-3-methyl-5-hydroxy-6-metoxy-1,4-benzoquinol methylase